MGYTKETVRNGVGANGHNLFNARRSIHPSTRPITLPLVPTGVLGR